jgi:hypothetical protein
MRSTTCDVLIAGSGVAGFTAALALHDRGLRVIMVEKEAVFGGTSAYAAGMPWVPANPEAIAHGDTPEKAFAYLRNEVGRRLNEEKAAAFLANCNAAISFLEHVSEVRFSPQPTWPDYHPNLPGAATGRRGLLPVKFDGRRLKNRFADLRPPLTSMMIFGRMMVGREDLPHLFAMRRSPRSALYCCGLFIRYLFDRLRYQRGARLVNGNALMAALASAAFTRKIPLSLSSPLTRLVVHDGRVAGGIVETPTGLLEIEAAKAVVLACGGFPWDERLKAQYFSHVGARKQHVSAAPRGNTGDGIRLALEIGGIFDSSASQAAAWTPVSLVPQASGLPVPFPHFIDRAKPGVIVVDRRGRRFANEAVSYHDFVPRMIEACRDDDRVEAFVIADHRTFRKYGLGAVPAAPAPFRSFLRTGYLMRAESLRELAARAGIDPDGFVGTVSEFNSLADDGLDPLFGRGSDSYQRFNGDGSHKPNPCVGPIRQAPFYAVRIIPGDLGTFMGLATDPCGRVLGNDSVVSGLYAVGNDAANVFCGHYPGPGSTIGPAITFAYVAAQTIADTET